jgi:hypothetical protein
MWKRKAIYAVCRYLVTHGVSPDEIAKLLHWRKDFRIWFTVDGVLDADAFNRLAQEKSSNYNPGRWFSEDDELIVLNGKTYAFSSQWGGANWHEAMKTLRDAFPQFQINYSAAT